MKLFVRSLFLKIFLWFWATAIVTAVALVLAFVLGPQSVPALWYTTLTETARYTGQTAIERVEAGGPAACSAYLERRQDQSGLRACLFDSLGHRISGRQCEAFLGMILHVTPSRTSYFDVRYGLARVALKLNGAGGYVYTFATELPAGPRAALGMSGGRIGAQWGVAFLVSGFVCILLTRYLTTPILYLRRAAQELAAAGNFGVRAPAEISRRRDEIGELARDFNTMAERIEELIRQQRQLLSDISHELRSPLARLNVALDLGRERKGDDVVFEHMERDLECLNGMIARLLMVATLDSRSEPISMDRVNLTELALRISQDARFESQRRVVTIDVIAGSDIWVVGNLKLLHSALENVIRNAIRYTAPESSVEVELLRVNAEGPPRVLVIVCDQGPGVPDCDLSNIFRPFYRVEGARDRDSGGMGLGLAIADRIVRLHGGTITARNRSPKGLQIDMVMPQGHGL